MQGDNIRMFTNASILVVSLAALILMSDSVSAFAPRSTMRTRISLNSKGGGALKMGLPPQVAAGLAAPVMYGLMSINEYMTHRWYQHAEISKVGWWKSLGMPKVKGGGHVEHHAETLDDMTLKTDAKWRESPAAKSLDDDVYRGTAFTWLTSGIMTIQMCISVIPIYTLLLGFSLSTTFALLFPSMMIHALIWNALHPNMHGLPDMPISGGAPASWMAGLRNSKFFKFLYQNHEGHHVLGGQGNYNVCCPGTDHLVGTYIPEAAWRPRQAASLAKMNDNKNSNNVDPVLA